MQVVTWSTFCVSNALAKTAIHFFPSSGTVTAPYPATCKFTLFSEGERAKSVALEGLRLSQPDGVQLNDVFPFLRDGVDSLMGLHVTLSTAQPRIDLTLSDCIVEISSRAHSVHFRAKRIGGVKEEVSVGGSALAVNDSFQRSSLVMVNGGEESFQPELTLLQKRSGASAEADDFKLKEFATVPAWSAEEVLLDEFLPGKEAGHDSRTDGIELPRTIPAGTACYMMYRDRATKLPVSVVAI